ncbi:unnamed protein product [Somion occarium]|uniref:Protein kinase domain-containing protein n=1 Tax=Somion occarium TaxID=3059160 RepID=A0ABP1DI48_9APHY
MTSKLGDSETPSRSRGKTTLPNLLNHWVPSWSNASDTMRFDHEDSYHNRGSILDATRMSDNETVVLKKISTQVHPFEAEITKSFSTEPISSHPRNRCIPLLDVISVPDIEDTVLLILPLLRSYDDPRFKSVGEAVAFFTQIFEGLQFIHQCHIAHRDCMNLNIMMDPKPIFPKLYHPAANRRTKDFSGRAKYYTRTVRPVKYYFIDFGISRQYSPDDVHPLEDPILGGDKTVPEFQNSNAPCDPFATNIYYLGNLIREDFFERTKGLDFMEPLVADMVQDDPSKRPKIDEVVKRFEKICCSLHWWTLRSRLVEREEDDSAFGPSIRAIHHFFRTTTHVLTFKRAIPTPRH